MVLAGAVRSILQQTLQTNFTRGHLRNQNGPRNIYVSSSTGSDSNSGLSPASPKATIAAGVALLRNGVADHLLLLRGDTWDETIVWSTSGSGYGTGRQMLSSYGTSTTRPKIRSGVSDGFRLGTAVDHLLIQGIEFTAHTYDGSSGTPVGIKLAQRCSDITVYYCYVHNYTDGLRVDPPVAVGSVATTIEFSFSTAADCYASAANPATGLYFARTNDMVVRYNTISKVGEVDPGVNHHGVYIRGGSTYGCGGYNDISRNNIWEIAGIGVKTHASNTFVGENSFAYTAIAAGFQGRDPVTPFTEGLRNSDFTDNAIWKGRDTNGSNARGWGVIMEHVNVNSATTSLLDVAHNVYVDSGTATDPHPLVIHPSWPTKNGDGVKSVHFVDHAIHEWHGPIKLNDDDVDAANLVELDQNFIKSTASHYIIEHNLNNGAHYRCSYAQMLSASSSGTRYRYNGSNNSQAQWVAHLTLPSNNNNESPPTGSDESRTLATYDTVVGGAGTFADLVALCRAQTEFNWRWELAGDAIASYMIDGHLY